MLTFRQKGNFRRFNNILSRSLEAIKLSKLDKYGKMGVEALQEATPKDTGLTANSWSYEITRTGETIKISWTNSNIVDGLSIAVLLQYGHGTRDGGYVSGIDYINPAMKPIFDEIADAAWKEVSRT